MGYVLYGSDRSGSCIVEAALAEIGVDFELNPVDLRNEAQRDAAYASVNPQRKLPALVTPDGEILTESAAIVLTLAERHPQAQLLPAVGSQERALALRWLLFAAAELYPIIEIVDYPERFSPSDAATPGVREVALEIWRSRWLKVEQALAEGPFLLGNRFCATDIYLAVVSRWSLPDEWRSANIPNLEQLASAVADRPKIRQLWRRHFKAR
jgi:glutathione S-transferase